MASKENQVLYDAVCQSVYLSPQQMTSPMCIRKSKSVEVWKGQRFVDSNLLPSTTTTEGSVVGAVVAYESVSVDLDQCGKYGPPRPPPRPPRPPKRPPPPPPPYRAISASRGSICCLDSVRTETRSRAYSNVSKNSGLEKNPSNLFSICK
jgi:hypothetical protein